MMQTWDDPRVKRGMEKLFALRRERLAVGDKLMGWKVAFGAKASQEKLGIGAPLLGFLTQGGALASGVAVSFEGWAQPVAEPEIAVTMGSDLAGGADAKAARAAISALGPAIELVDFARPPEDVELLLSGNISHRYVVLGSSDTSRAGARVDGLQGRIFRRGMEAASTSNVQANTGELPVLVQYVANYLAAFGERLRAGEIVICGSIVPPVFLDPDETDFRYQLDPVGEVTVRFERQTQQTSKKHQAAM